MAVRQFYVNGFIHYVHGSPAKATPAQAVLIFPLRWDADSLPCVWPLSAKFTLMTLTPSDPVRMMGISPCLIKVGDTWHVEVLLFTQNTPAFYRLWIPSLRERFKAVLRTAIFMSADISGGGLYLQSALPLTNRLGHVTSQDLI